MQALNDMRKQLMELCPVANFSLSS